MPAIVVIGGQWGDEGKGRIVDLLARSASIIARYSAGNNAGHTVINDLGEFRLHLVPAGIFYPDKTCLITNGVVIDPAVLLDEIESLRTRGVSVERLFVSDRAHVLMPYHRLIDRSDEAARGAAAIGTTGRGVGPAFVDKVGRVGIRMAELVDPTAFKERLGFVLPYKNALLEKFYGLEPLRFEDVYSEYVEYGCKLAPFVRDTALVVQEALDRNETVLLEGAQGSLLDLDAGTYEYVTSSVPSSSAGGAGLGAGIGPTAIAQVYGVFKAYMTRVGSGPMPTELLDEVGETLREQGQEYGTTTGRARRCGWFDAVASRYSARVNSVTGAVLTRLDVLDKFPRIGICTGYELDGKVINSMPATVAQLNRVRPVYEEHEGWQTKTTDVRRFADLPIAAQRYVQRIEQLLGTPIKLVSVGPERDQAIHVSKTL
jgi:adenylosuccinate synthase